MPYTRQQRREYMRERLKDPARRKKHNEWRAKRRKNKRAWLVDIKSKYVCAKCGENNPICLEFHHVGKKDFDISVGIRNDKNKEAILKEIEKCIVLCANCHRKEHRNSLS